MAILDDVKRIMNEKLGIDPETITMETNIHEDINADSLDIIDVISEIEDTYNIHIPTEKLAEINTVADMIQLVEAER